MIANKLCKYFWKSSIRPSTFRAVQQCQYFRPISQRFFTTQNSEGVISSDEMSKSDLQREIEEGITKAKRKSTKKKPLTEQIKAQIMEMTSEGEMSERTAVKKRKSSEKKTKKEEQPPAEQKVKVLPIDRLNQGVNEAIKNLNIEGTTIIRTREEARKAVEILRQHKQRIAAWDTETIHIDAKNQSPVGNGQIICAQVFIGPDVDFGNGARVFIDNYADADGVIMEFKDYFEDETYLKCFHNYGYDRHIFMNHGIDVKGFGGDTMHMARLCDPSRQPNQYSLSSLSEIYGSFITDTKNEIIKNLRNKYLQEPEKYRSQLQTLQAYEENSEKTKKINIKETFGFYNELKDGTTGKVLQFPDIEEMHTDPKHVVNWVNYSTFDAEVTYYLREALSMELMKLKTVEEDMTNLMELYAKYWLPFGEVLTDMERVGIKVDIEYLKKIEMEATKDKIEYESKFLDWVHKVQEDASEFNPSSAQQMQQLLYAPFFKQGEENIKDPDGNPIYHQQRERLFRVDNNTGFIKEGKKEPLKYRDMKIVGFGIPAFSYTASKLPSADAPAIKVLAGNPDTKQYGKAYEHFKNQNMEQFGIELCEALSNWLKFKQIETLLQTYIIPLQRSGDKYGRIHCSMNLNTETGRLSARKPNLQNQPALDKDKYKIRKAFVAEKGNKLIVADYGQLELRILAHMTKCEGMIQAFKLGGDFHSRTALSMYPQIQKEIDEGKLLLEWDNSKGKPPLPLFKEKYSNERKKAKIMNFSIAYGKTVHGFTRDWNCSLDEAQKTVDLWYNDRKEVKAWQKQIQQTAQESGWTKTLLGRYRNLTKHFITTGRDREHGLRAAINTPIQGGAADIVIAAMVKIQRDQKLKDLGYKMLLQIHDEIIMEGPEENAEEALQQLKLVMEHPLDQSLLVDLEVDAKIASSWYEGK